MKDNIQTGNTPVDEISLTEKQKNIAILKTAVASTFLFFITIMSMFALAAEAGKGFNSTQFFIYLVFFSYLIFYIRLISKVYLLFRKKNKDNIQLVPQKNSTSKIVHGLIFTFAILATVVLAFFLSFKINAVTEYFLYSKINSDTTYILIVKLISDLTIHILVLYYLLRLVTGLLKK